MPTYVQCICIVVCDVPIYFLYNFVAYVWYEKNKVINYILLFSGINLTHNIAKPHPFYKNNSHILWW